MDDCIFCIIVAGDIPSDILYRDDEVIAFRDANPVAPTHILIIPVEHFATTRDIPDDNISLSGKYSLNSFTNVCPPPDLYQFAPE